MTPKEYLRDRILIEYLIDVKQKDILTIINDKTLEADELLKEIRLHFNIKNNGHNKTHNGHRW